MYGLGLQEQRAEGEWKESAYNSQTTTREASGRCPLRSPRGAALSAGPALSFPVLPVLPALVLARLPACSAGTFVWPSAKAARCALHSGLCPQRSPRGRRRQGPFSEALATPAPFPPIPWIQRMLWGPDRGGPFCHESSRLHPVGIEISTERREELQHVIIAMKETVLCREKPILDGARETL